MGGWSKAIGAGLGFFMGGPIGMVAGYVIGGALGGPSGQRNFANPKYREHILFTNILAFMALVVKADNKVTASERKEVMKLLNEMFQSDYQDTQLTHNMFEKFLNTHIDIRELCGSFNRVADKNMRIILIEILFKIAFADRNFHPAEKELIERIAGYLGISEYELHSMNGRYSSAGGYSDGSGHSAAAKRDPGDMRRYYDILEVPYNANQAEIKSSYRKLIVKYHPDKFGDIHPVAGKLINEKVAVINEAYEKLLTKI